MAGPKKPSRGKTHGDKVREGLRKAKEAGRPVGRPKEFIITKIRIRPRRARNPLRSSMGRR